MVGIPRNVFRHGQRQRRREFRQLGNFFFFFLFLPTARSSDSGFLSLVIMISSVVTEMQSERENAGKRKSIDNNGNVQRRALVSEPMASKFPPNSKT